jgi:hypothetical protein
VTTRTATKAGLITRRMIIAMVAMGIVALALGYFVHPVYAADPATLNEQQVGTNSAEDAADFPCPGDEVPAGMVLWHFILNGIDPGITSAIAGQFEFADDGTLNVDSSKWNPGGTEHQFFVYTTGDDVLQGATADIGDSTYNNFVLSHICHGEETEQSVPASVEQSVAASVSASVPASAESSVKAGTGTPAASTSNTALFGNGSSPLPTIAFSLILLASLGALAYANVKSVRS